VKSSFGRRLFLVTALEIAVVLGLLVIAGMLFAFNAYIGTIRTEQATTLDGVTAGLVTPATMHDARAAGAFAASRYPRSSVSVLLIDAERRVVVSTSSNTAAPTIDVRKRGDHNGDPIAHGMFAQLVFGLATVFGLSYASAHVGSIDIVVRANPPVLVKTVRDGVPAFLIALLVALAIAFVLARALTRQVLRPLVDVTGALERFAAGDLTPQPIVANARESLGSLAVAYNGAIAQMEHAFGERDRANARMRQFVADAGHQLRTPLTVMRGFIAILRKGELRTPADRERILETMHRQSQIMASLIEKLMLLDRWDAAPENATPPEAIDIGRLVGDVVTPIADTQPTRSVRIDAPAGPLAAIDPSDLTHALTNIVDNALKYTTGAIDVSVRRNGSSVVVEVVDEGPGMTPDEVRQAFERFYRGPRRDIDGSGLGLSIARRALERAGGKLELQSDPERGSRFTLTLPAAAPKREKVAV
jgi:two-component system OmpR family sensor kinase